MKLSQLRSLHFLIYAFFVEALCCHYFTTVHVRYPACNSWPSDKVLKSYLRRNFELYYHVIWRVLCCVSKNTLDSHYHKDSVLIKCSFLNEKERTNILVPWNVFYVQDNNMLIMVILCLYILKQSFTYIQGAISAVAVKVAFYVKLSSF